MESSVAITRSRVKSGHTWNRQHYNSMQAPTVKQQQITTGEVLIVLQVQTHYTEISYWQRETLHNEPLVANFWAQTVGISRPTSASPCLRCVDAVTLTTINVMVTVMYFCQHQSRTEKYINCRNDTHHEALRVSIALSALTHVTLRSRTEHTRAHFIASCSDSKLRILNLLLFRPTCWNRVQE